MMNIIDEEKERYEKEVALDVLLWIERLLLFLFLVSSESYIDRIGLGLLMSTLIASMFFFFFLLFPIHSSPGLFGIDGFWWFLLNRIMLLFITLQSLEAKYNMLWPLTLLTFIVNLSVYIFECLVKSSKPHNDEIPKSTESREIEDETDDVGDVSKDLEKIRELVKELRKDEKKMDIEMEFMENVIYSGLETHRKNLSLKLLELRKELKDDEEKIKLMKNFIYSELVTLEDNLSLNVNEDIKAWRDDVRVIAEEVRENYLVIQETAKAAKTTANRANLTYLATQAVIDEIGNMRLMIKEEDLEGFLELREEVRRMSLDFEARKIEAEDIAERAAEELSYATVELVEAVEFRHMGGVQI